MPIIKMTVPTNKILSSRLNAVLARMSHRAGTPAAPFMAQDKGGVITIFRREDEKRRVPMQ